MRRVTRASLFLTTAVYCVLSCGPNAIAQEQAAEAAELPPLEVTAKQTKKKSAAKAAPPASAPAPVEPVPALQDTPIKVSGEPPIGTNTTEITSQDLDRINPSDIQDVFSGVPGISVGSSLPISQKVYVNGIEETNLLVTIDGSRQNNKLFHHSGTNYIDPALLKAIRVDAGVAPADAGPGALAGAIAYETKDVADLLAPGRSLGGSLAGDYETNGNIFTTSLTAYARNSGFEALGFAKYGDGGIREDGNGDDISGSETSLISGLGKLAYQGPSGDRVEVSYESVTDDALRPFRADWGMALTRPYDMRRQNAVFSYTDESPTGLWDPTIKLAYSTTDLQVTDDDYDSSGDTGSLNGKIENRFKFGSNSVVAGVDFYDDEIRFDSNCLYSGCDPAETYRVGEDVLNVGAYSQARLEGETARLSFGGRYDHQWFEGWDGTKITTSGFSGNVSGELDLTSWLTANAGYSRVWSGIPLYEAFILGPWVSYSDGIEDTTANNAIAGLKFHYNGFSLHGRIFETKLYNVRAAIKDGDLMNDQDARSRGFDVTGEYTWETGFFRLAYANIDVELDGRATDTYLSRYMATPVGEIITAQIVHTFPGTGVTVGADAQIALKQDDIFDWATVGYNPSNPIPGYEVVNAFVEYNPVQFSNLTLRLDVKNMFDEAYATRTTYGQEFEADGVETLLEPGRSFRFGAKLTY